MDVKVLLRLATVLLLIPRTESLEPCDMLYHSGVEAFAQADYAGVVRYMEKALRSFSQVRQTTIRCRLKCEDQNRLSGAIGDPFFDTVLRRAACLNQCIEGEIGTQSMHKVSEDVLQDFHRRIPYNYLQLAYRKVK